MHKNKKFLAIIPARGGSKRLPHKNILPLNNKPLIAWSIEASLNSELLDFTVVTTDSEEISDISQKYSVHIIPRPKELSADTSTTIDVVLHTLSKLKENFDYIVLLQPTSPLRTTKHINEAIDFLLDKSADAVVSVCEMDHSPLWANKLDENSSMKDFFNKDISNKRSQDLATYYRINGAIYICDVKKLLEEKSFFLKENIYAYKMDKKASVDIDEEIDFKLAELLFD